MNVTLDWFPPYRPATPMRDYSGIFTETAVQLFPALDVPRTWFFVQILSPDGIIALDFMGDSPSIGNGGSIVLAGQYSYLCSANLGVNPPGAVWVVGNSNGVAVSAFACPE
jgi:hypothetical protein